MAETAATIVVSISDPAADNKPVLTLDDTLNIGADGKVKTQFLPGERVYVLLQIPDGVVVTDVRCSDGSIAKVGDVSREQTDRLTIDEASDQLTLSKIPAGDLEPTWYGNSGSLSLDGKTLTVSGDLPAIVDLTYAYTATSYILSGPAVALAGGEEWPVRVTAYTPEEADADNCPA